jgi:ketol-acid reductoisomerase
MKCNRAFLVILFLAFGMLTTSIPQFTYAQPAENEIIENTLETVEKSATEGISEITESVSNASKSVATATENATQPTNNTTSSQTFQQIENIATGNATQSAIAGAREQIEETVSGTQSAIANATEGAENATEGTQTPTEGPMEIGKNFLDQIWGQVTNLFK